MIFNDTATNATRYDTKENWLSVNPVLEQGEFVTELDNGGISCKVGDGSTAYADLKYVSGLNASYPVGSIYMTIDSKNPKDLFGGNWELIKDRFLIGAGNSYQVGSTGGEATHTLTVAEMPSHNHSTYGEVPMINLDVGSTRTWGHSSTNSDWWFQSVNNSVNYNGGSQAHNNIPPYLAVYIWKRVS